MAGWRKEGRYAVSDGASESFDSANWARTLCLHFLRNIHVGTDWLNAARYRYSLRSNIDLDDWSAQLAFERGSFATFLGLTISSAQLVAHAIGDTTLFFITGADQFVAFPDLAESGYGNSPILLSSVRRDGDAIENDEFFLSNSLIIEPPAFGWYGTTIVAVTDSLAAWVLTPENRAEQWERLNELCAVHDAVSFQNFCFDAMAARGLRRDDFTLLVLEL